MELFEKVRELTELRDEEAKLYSQQRELIYKNVERKREPMLEKVKEAKEAFKTFFPGNGFVLQETSNDDILRIESIINTITLQLTDSNSFSFTLIEKDTENHSKNLFYTILIEEPKETIYYHQYTEQRNSNGELNYSGKSSIEVVKKQIQKLKNDIEELSKQDRNNELTFVLGDSHYVSLEKEFKDINDLFKEILSQYKM